MKVLFARIVIIGWFISLILITPYILAQNVPGGGTGTGGNVSVIDNGTTVTINNGIVSFTVTKASATVTKLNYNGLQLYAGGYNGGQLYWSWNMPNYQNPSNCQYSLTADPATNGGNYAEIKMHMAWNTSTTTAAMDVDIYYSLPRGAQGFYATAIISHPATYPDNPGGEWRMASYPGSIFDWISVDQERNRLMPTGTDWANEAPVWNAPKEVGLLTSGNFKGTYECKYDYSADLGSLDVWGWSSTTHNVGIWVTAPSKEYYNGGPMKRELTCHATPVLLNMLGGQHYGMGNNFNMAAGENVQKTFGPFLIYVNKVATGTLNAPAALWEDAKAQAKAEQGAWPYTWFVNPAYVQESGRGTVKGTIKINDPGNQTASSGNLWVGLTTLNGIDFQLQAKNYQYWVKSDSVGNFTIPHILPGTYGLFAFGPGANGTYENDGVIVTAGQTNNLGTLKWTPTRLAPTIWEIGIPDRSAAEFKYGTNATGKAYWHGEATTTSTSNNWSAFMDFATDFPDGLTYTIGGSNWTTDWNYCQPTIMLSDSTFIGTTWKVKFFLSQAPAAGAQASIYTAFAASFGSALIISVNGTNITSPSTGFFPSNPSDATFRMGIHGAFSDNGINFPGVLLKQGWNEIDLTQRRGGSNENIISYDYLRLECDGLIPPITINGSNLVCAGTNGTIYSATSVAGTVYNWKVPTGSTITSGAGTNKISVQFGTVSGMVSVIPIQGTATGTGANFPVVVNPLPSAISSISGLNEVCALQKNVVYSVTTAPGISSFNWSIPLGSTLISGSGSNLIQVNIGSISGFISVTPVGACGTGTGNSLPITVTGWKTPSASIVSSEASICSGTGVSFTATGINGGTLPTYYWYKNNYQIGTGATFNYVPQNGDLIRAVALTGGLLPSCLSQTSAVSNIINVTVNPYIHPNITISSSSTAVCNGVGITYTASGTNAGTLPTIAWFKNNVQLVTGSTLGFIPVNGDAVFAKIIAGGTLPKCLSSTTSLSNIINAVVSPNINPIASIFGIGISLCDGSRATFSATGINGGTNPIFSWLKNNTPIATGSTFSFTPQNGDIISSIMTVGGTLPSCLSTNTVISNLTVLTVSSISYSSVSISSSATSVCSGTGILMTAAGMNGGTIPQYTWYKNSIQAATGPFFSYFPQNGDAIVVKMSAGGLLPSCLYSATSSSNIINLTVNPVLPVSVTLQSSSTSVCSGTGISLTAIGTNAGDFPQYTWYVNNALKGTGTLLGFVPSNGDQVKAVLTASGTCLTGNPAVSPPLQVSVSPKVQPSVLVSPSANPTCSGTGVVYTATPSNLGTFPIYAWYVNNSMMPVTSGTFDYSPSDGDVVTVLATVGGALPNCIAPSTASSSPIISKVSPSLRASVTIVGPTSTICQGGSATFTSSGTNMGTDPSITWYNNGLSVSTGASFSYLPTNGDQVQAVLNVGGTLPGCLSNNFAVSNVVGIMVSTCAGPIVTGIVGPTFVLSGSAGVTYSVPGMVGNTYQWTVPSGAAITSGQGTNSITVDFGTGTGGALGLTENNGRVSTKVELQVYTGTAPAIGGVTGDTGIIPGQVGVVYSVASVPGTNYQWTLPIGATVTSGFGTNSVTVDYGTEVGGTVSVTATNPYGSSTSTLDITKDITTGLTGTGLASQGVLVYPNPFTGSTQIFCKGKFALAVFNLIGELIEIEQYEESVRVGDEWHSGTYLIKIQPELGNYYLLKVIKE